MHRKGQRRLWEAGEVTEAYTGARPPGKKPRPMSQGPAGLTRGQKRQKCVLSPSSHFYKEVNIGKNLILEADRKENTNNRKYPF